MTWKGNGYKTFAGSIILEESRDTTNRTSVRFELGTSDTEVKRDNVEFTKGLLVERGSTVRFPAGAGNFLFTTAPKMALGPTQPLIQWVLGSLSLGVKRPGREADHSPPSSAEVKE
jgi:hypothetical protein